MWAAFASSACVMLMLAIYRLVMGLFGTFCNLYVHKEMARVKSLLNLLGLGQRCCLFTEAAPWA